MPATERISVAMGKVELRLAKAAAAEEGSSFSAFVTGAVRDRLAEKRRRQAAAEVVATFAASELPTTEEQSALLALWSAPRATRKRRAASGRRER